MGPAVAVGADRVRPRRPKDRRARITRAAAEVFSTRGYHGASLSAIAAKIGISAPALYRHYPNKYQMFTAVVLALATELADSTALVDDVADGELATDPVAVLDRVIGSLIETTIANRRSGGLYRWQARYLQAEDTVALLRQVELINRRIQRPLVLIRPVLTGRQRWLLSVGVLSTLGSIVDHRIELPAAQLRVVLAEAAWAVLTADLPEPGDDTVGPPAPRRLFATDAGTDEAVLGVAMELFGHLGYANTSMTQIAEAAGISVAKLYRHFPGKYQILAGALRYAADRIPDELSAIADDIADPRQALIAMIEAYTAAAFVNPELALVYYTDQVNLTAADRAALHEVWESSTAARARLLIAARPEVGEAQAGVLVHAASALVADLGWLVSHDRSADADPPTDGTAYPLACVRTLMERVLIGDSPTSATS